MFLRFSCIVWRFFDKATRPLRCDSFLPSGKGDSVHNWYYKIRRDPIFQFVFVGVLFKFQ